MVELALDMAGAGGAVALRFGATLDQVLARELDVGPGRGEAVFDLLDELFDDAGVDIQSLSSVICTVGPGSFTGVRVGVALAKGLALASGADLLGVPRTLVVGRRALTMNDWPHEGAVFVSLLNAGRGGVFVQLCALKQCAKERGEMQVVGEPQLIPLDELEFFAAQHKVGVFGGPEPLDVLLEGGVCLPKAISYRHVPIAAEDLWLVDAPFLLRGGEVNPLYVRLPDAKVQEGFAIDRRTP